MADEKSIEQMTADELRRAIANFLNPVSQGPAAPVPAGLDTSKLKPGEAEAVSDYWISTIMSKPAHVLSAQEREALRAACARAAREGGQ